MIENNFLGVALIYVSTLGGCYTHKCIKSVENVALISSPFEKIVALILRTPLSKGFKYDHIRGSVNFILTSNDLIYNIKKLFLIRLNSKSPVSRFSE